MIVLPFIPAIAAALAPIVNGAVVAVTAVATALAPVVNAVLFAAGTGAVAGGAICAATGAYSSYQEHGTVIAESFHEVPKCVAEAALIGGAFGGAGYVLAPALGPVLSVADELAQPASQFLDDAAKSVIYTADDAGKAVMQAADDAIGPTVRGIRSKADSTAKSVGRTLGAPMRVARSTKNAANFKSLPKGAGNKGYVYVMDDVANPGRFKIGRTTNPPQRLNGVQSKLNQTVGGRVQYSCIISTDDMKLLEDSLKAQFKPQNITGHAAGTEWFVLNAAQVATACAR